ncbi:MAG: thermonuclease family protein [Candidatus Thermoplasmatota archaeon]|nr:thermonuclease family protein [Candidatus Thermoplasmatota archaeon]
MMKTTLKISAVISILLVYVSISGCVDLPSEPDLETESVEVLSVVDGDTIEVEFENGTEGTVRILGVDTPEVHTDVDTSEWEDIDNRTWLERCGLKASNFTKRWISSEVDLIFDENEGKKGYYGRYLAYVELENSTDLGAELTKNGWARVYTEGNCQREDQYLDHEEEARKDGEGVWERA